MHTRQPITMRPRALLGPSFLVFLVLSGCGGGGGGDDGAGPGTVPPVAQLATMENQATATPSAENADDLARALMLGMRAGLVLPDMMPFSLLSSDQRNFDSVFPGHGGTETISGRFRQDGSGWMRVDYADYFNNIKDLDGRVEFSADPGRTTGRMHVYDMRVRASDLEFRLSANLTYTYQVGGNGQVVTMLRGELSMSLPEGPSLRLGLNNWRYELACEGSPAPCVRYLSSYRLSMAPDSLHDSTWGRVAYSTETGLVDYRQIRPQQVIWGDFRIAGDGNTVLGVHPRSVGWLGLTLDEEGEPQRFAGRSLPDLIAGTPHSPTPTAPRANAGKSSSYRVGTTHRIDAFNSTDDDGDFLTATWTVKRAPRGGTLTLTDQDTARPSIRSTDGGPFLIELSVDDGTTTADSYLVVGDDIGTFCCGLIFVDEPTGLSLGGNRRATVGQEVILDARVERSADGSILTTWTLEAAEPGTAVLTDLGDGRVRFTATTPGYYRVRANGDLIVIAVDQSVLFEPPMEMSSTRMSSRSVFASDVDGDGRSDLIGISNDADPHESMRLYRQSSPGVFLPPQVLAGGSLYALPLVMDLDDDGRTDIFAQKSRSNGRLQRQTSSGGFQLIEYTAVPPTACSNHFSPLPSYWRRDVDGDGRLDAVTTIQGCPIRLFWHGANRSALSDMGELVLPALPAFAGVFDIWAGDFDGDGDMDAARLEESSNEMRLRFLERQVDGSFADAGYTAVPEIKLSVGGRLFESVDLEGDGRHEIVGMIHGNPGLAGRAFRIRRTAVAWEIDTFDFPAGSLVSGVNVVDLDGDSREELAVTYSNGFVILSAPTGALRASTLYPIDISGDTHQNISNLAIGDFDGDGSMDIVDRFGTIRFGR